MGQCDNTEAYDNFTSQWGRDSQTGRALILMGRPTNASNVSLDDVNMTEIIDEIRASFNESSASSRRRMGVAKAPTSPPPPPGAKGPTPSKSVGSPTRIPTAGGGAKAPPKGSPTTSPTGGSSSWSDSTQKQQQQQQQQQQKQQQQKQTSQDSVCVSKTLNCGKNGVLTCSNPKKPMYCICAVGWAGKDCTVDEAKSNALSESLANAGLSGMSGGADDPAMLNVLNAYVWSNDSSAVELAHAVRLGCYNRTVTTLKQYIKDPFVPTEEGSLTALIDPWVSRKFVDDYVDNLQRHNWIDEATREVEVKLPSYNLNTNVFALVRIPRHFSATASWPPAAHRPVPNCDRV